MHFCTKWGLWILSPISYLYFISSCRYCVPATCRHHHCLVGSVTLCFVSNTEVKSKNYSRQHGHNNPNKPNQYGQGEWLQHQLILLVYIYCRFVNAALGFTPCILTLPVTDRLPGLGLTHRCINEGCSYVSLPGRLVLLVYMLSHTAPL